MDFPITAKTRRVWKKINAVIMSDTAGDVIPAMIGGMTGLIRKAFPSYTEIQARAHLAAIVLSPTGARPGSLLPMVEAELAKLHAEGSN